MALETWQGEALAQSGRLRAGLAELDRALARLPDPQLSPLEWAFTAIWGASWRIALGLWPEAEATLDQCERLAVTEREVGSQLAAVASELACRRGDLDEASRLAAWANEQLGPWQESGWDTSGDHAAAARARVAAIRGRYAQAHRLLEPMLRRPGKGVAARMWPAVGLAAEIEADRATSPGDAASAEEFIGLVTAATDELPSEGPYLSAWQRHARADLARAGRADSAETWTEVCDAWRALEHVTNLGWASYRLAQVCLREGDKLSAEASLTEAWHVADSLGAVPLRDRALELAQLAHVPIRAEAGRVVDGRRPAGGKLRHLTDRELEVLRHVAVGRSNNEIGESLFISPKTVSVHVSSILTKLGVTTRTNAATIAVEEGLDVHRA
jgi:ATP/maltotriose-dependent transcriptional regulator MalT